MCVCIERETHEKNLPFAEKVAKPVVSVVTSERCQVKAKGRASKR